jgi:hypothetical protein
MVVVAVRDAKTPHRAVPLAVKLLLATGFAVAGWLITALLGSPSASADEPPTGIDTGQHHTAAEHKQHAKAAPEKPGGLIGLIDATLTTLVKTVDQVANTVTGTVTSAVATADKAVIEPVTTTVLAPAPARHETTSTTRSRTEVTTTTGPSQAVAPATVTPVASPVAQTPQPAAAPLQQPVVKHRPASLPHVISHFAALAHPVDAHGTAPAPAPTSPSDGQFCGIAAAHDSGNNSKHPLAILGARMGTTPVQSIGVPRQHTFVDNSRDAALPTTSPD